MGTDVHVIVVGGAPTQTARARARIEELEARWSRFRPESELCRLNRAEGAPVLVHPLTFELLVRSREAWRQTGGAFDPTILEALAAAGYDRDFATVAPDGAAEEPRAHRGSSSFASIDLDPIVGTVRVPAGVALDLGGIAKGFAADLVALELAGEGADGVCVNLGGDLRVLGRGPDPSGAWLIEVEPEVPGDRAPVLLGVGAAGIATTSRCRRTWRRGGELRHHLIDPRTGRPAETSWAAATVIAGSAADAEPLAKALVLAPSLEDAEALVRETDVAALLVGLDGERTALGPLGDFLVAPTDLSISWKSAGPALEGLPVPSTHTDARPLGAHGT